MDFLKSPAEISTLFLALTIGFYVFLFWRSQINAQNRYVTNRRKNDGLPNRSHHRRRLFDKAPAENLVINHLFEDDGDKDQATTH